MLEWDPKDPELEADLAFLEAEWNNYKSYLKSIEQMDLAVTKKKFMQKRVLA